MCGKFISKYKKERGHSHNVSWTGDSSVISKKPPFRVSMENPIFNLNEKK